MNKSQAKFVLSSHRTDRPLPVDAALEQALNVLQSEPELQEWFRQEEQSDQAIRSSLRAVTPPQELRSSILAGYRAGTPEPEIPSRSRWMAIAACLTISLLLWGGWLAVDRARHPATFADFHAAMPVFLNQGFTMDYVDDRLDQVTRWLASNKSIQGYTLPASLSELQSIGCRTLRWHSRSVALICFFLPDGKEVHLFAMNSADFKDNALGTTPHFSKEGIWNTASWKQGHWTYLMASQTSEERLRQLLPKEG